MATWYSIGKHKERGVFAVIECENMFFFSRLNACGGVETFLYYLAKTYNNFVVYYSDDTSDLMQIDRLSDYVEVRKWRGERIKCKRAFWNYNPGIIDYVDADEHIQVIHMNYKSQNRVPRIHPKMTKWCGVSKVACQEFSELTGKECELLYNLVALDVPKKVLKLISATRLTEEKGREEIIKLGDTLDSYGIPYLWLIFTNDYKVIKNPNIIYMEPRLDITGFIQGADYLVQLSSSESFCFSVVEALMLGIPCIVRDLPIWSDIGLKDRENCFILNFDMSDIPVQEIYKGLKSFKYTPPKSNWDLYLDNNGDYDPNEMTECRASCKFWDIVEKVWHEKGDIIKCNKKRKNVLTSLGLVDIL